MPAQPLVPPPEPDPHALESLDDLISRREQDARREQSESVDPSAVPASPARRDIAGPRSPLTTAEAGAGSSAVVTSPITSPISGTGAHNGDSAFSSRTVPRDERRWNGFHLWRTESYNLRAARQRAALEAQRLAERGSWIKRAADAVTTRVGTWLGSACRGVRRDRGQDEDDSEEQKGSDTTRMVLLTLVIAGAQMAWTLEFGYGTPYLLSLGLSKSATSLVWIAGPVSGLIAQPLIGVLSDLSTSRCRRRQYILSSTLVLSLSTLTLAFSGPISTLLCDILHTGLADWDPRRKEAVKQINQGLAILAFWILDLSINALQASARALILDATPNNMHSRANAWHGRMTHVGNVVGYAAGWADLGSSRALAWLGGDQFRKFAVVSIIGVTTCAVITSVSIQEAYSLPGDTVLPSSAASQHTAMSPTDDHPRQARQRSRPPSPTFSKLMGEALGHIWHSIRRLPRAVRRVCVVQLFAFMGWFPFLFYATEWLIETRQAEREAHHAKLGGGDVTDKDKEMGSLALLLFAIVSLVSGAVLPFLSLSNSAKATQQPIHLEGPERQPLGRQSRAHRQVNGAGEAHGEEGAFYDGDDDGVGESQDKGVQASLSSSKKSGKLTLRTMWTLSSVLFGIQAGIVTFFVEKSSRAAIVLIASIGVPWAVASWVPFALVMEAVREAEEGLSPFEFDADWFAPQQVRRRRKRRKMDDETRRRSRTFSASLDHDNDEEESGEVDEEEARRRVARAVLDCGELVPSSSSPSGQSRRRPSRSLADESGSPRQRHSGVEGSNGGGPAAILEVTNVEDDSNNGSNANGDSLGGTVLGIHNLAVVLPQLVVAVVAALIFRATSSDAAVTTPNGKGGEVGGAVVWVIRFGGLQSLFAAILTRFVPLTRTERALRGDKNLLGNAELDEDDEVSEDETD